MEVHQLLQHVEKCSSLSEIAAKHNRGLFAVRHCLVDEAVSMAKQGLNPSMKYVQPWEIAYKMIPDHTLKTIAGDGLWKSIPS